MWRQGDLLIESIEAIPDAAEKQKSRIILGSKTTTHSHSIKEKKVCNIFRSRGNCFVEVFGPSASLIHQEHDTIDLPTGNYRIWQQREISANGFAQQVWD